MGLKEARIPSSVNPVIAWCRASRSTPAPTWQAYHVALHQGEGGYNLLDVCGGLHIPRTLIYEDKLFDRMYWNSFFLADRCPPIPRCYNSNPGMCRWLGPQCCEHHFINDVAEQDRIKALKNHVSSSKT